METLIASETITLKLLIDSRGQKVLFAEAGKDFVDFLLTLLSLPVGAVIGLLTSSDMVGSLGELHDSFYRLSNTYVQPGVNKNALFRLKSPVSSSSATKILSITNDTSSPAVSCPDCGTYVGGYHFGGVQRPNPNPTASEGGFVKGVVTYMIMDDLEVEPMSTISSITMLNKFNVKDVGALQEKTVSVTRTRGLELLKASFESKSVLTRVFLGK